MRTAAIIPAYNEELTIATVVLLTAEYVDEVIVVNDGSRDRTMAVASMAGATVLTHETNKGKAAALKTGLQHARMNDYEAVILLDADGQNNPSEIPSLMEPILDGTMDLVIGSRFIGERQDIPRYRRLGQKVLNVVTHASSGSKVSDSQSGFRAINRLFLEDFDVDSDGFNIETDMINWAVDRNLRITELPVTVRYDVPKPHKKNPVRHGFGVLGNIINALGYRRPLLLFGMLGTVMALIGILFFLVYSLGIEVLKISLISSSWTFWVMAFMFSGVVIFILGLVLNSQLMIKTEIEKMQQKLNHR